jgi:hypothetical protein
MLKIVQRFCRKLSTPFFAGEAGTNNCTNLMNQFDGVCERLGVPIANEKTEGPTTIYPQEVLLCKMQASHTRIVIVLM